MPITLYRGENREPQHIRDAGGFTARLQLDTDAVRAVLVHATIDATRDIAGITGRRTSQIVDYLLQNPGRCGLGPLYQQIKKEREASSIHISTETTPGGGGMGGGYVYRIQCPTPLYEWGPTRGGTMSGIDTPPRTIAVDADLTQQSVRAFLLTDTLAANVALDAVETADVVAIYSPAQMKEVAFLTALPYAWITGYRQDQGAWHPMP